MIFYVSKPAGRIEDRYNGIYLKRAEFIMTKRTSSHVEIVTAAKGVGDKTKRGDPPQRVKDPAGKR